MSRVKKHTRTRTALPARRRLIVRFVFLISGISGEPKARPPALVFRNSSLRVQVSIACWWSSAASRKSPLEIVPEGLVTHTFFLAV